MRSSSTSTPQSTPSTHNSVRNSKVSQSREEQQVCQKPRAVVRKVANVIEVFVIITSVVALGESGMLGGYALYDHYAGTNYLIATVNFVKDQVVNQVLPRALPGVTDAVTSTFMAIGASSAFFGVVGTWVHSLIKDCCLDDPRSRGYVRVPVDVHDSDEQQRTDSSIVEEYSSHVKSV